MTEREIEAVRHSPLLALVKSRHLLIAIDMKDDIDVKLDDKTANKIECEHYHLYCAAKHMTKRVGVEKE